MNPLAGGNEYEALSPLQEQNYCVWLVTDRVNNVAVQQFSSSLSGRRSSVSKTLPQVCPKAKWLSRIYFTAPSEAPFCWCIIKHVFWKMKESYDKRDCLCFPSELPQSHPNFPLCLSLIFSHLALPLLCFLSDYLHLFPFHSHSFNSSFVLFHFFLVFFLFSFKRVVSFFCACWLYLWELRAL